MAREQRKLAAILAADVVGYSRLMGRDESGTLARLRRNRAERLDPVLAKYGGRLVKLTGDGALVEFTSAVDALSAAIEFQQAMVEANRDQTTDTALVFRMGMHLGDLIVDGDDLYGDGVNVAARLEAEAPAGGIVISRTVHEAIAGRLSATFDDLGDLELKNIERPVQAFSVKWQPEDWRPPATSDTKATATTASQTSLPLPDKPSIAVLPFQNMSGDPEQEYFADGMVEEIITALSRFKSLFVIARNSSFTYKGKAVDIKQVGRELGVRYVLEGSVRKAGGKVRITGQLIDSQTGAHLWADRFEGSLDDVFELQDQVTETVAGVIGARVEEVEIERARRRPQGNPSAYDVFLRGVALFRARTRDSLEDARRHFYRAIELDPYFSTPYAHATFCYSTMKLHGFIDDAEQVDAEVRRLCGLVSTVGSDDALALSLGGFVLVWVCREYEAGASFVDKAIALNPNLAFAWQARGFVSMQIGDHEAALREYARAARLSPVGHDFHLVEGYSGLSCAFLGRNDDALRHGINARNHLPQWLVGPLVCAMVHGLQGNVEEARRDVAQLLSINQGLSLSTLDKMMVWRNDRDRALLQQGLRLAGLPE